MNAIEDFPRESIISTGKPRVEIDAQQCEEETAQRPYFITDYEMKFKFRTIGIMTLVVGVGIILVSGSLGSLRMHPLSITAASLEAQGLPSCHWLDVEGRLLLEDAIQETDNDNGAVTLYVPLVSSDWREGMSVALFARMSLEKSQKLPVQGKYCGYAQYRLPRPVQPLFAKAGFPPHASHSIFSLGDSPWCYIVVGSVCVMFGSSLAGLTFIKRKNPSYK